MSEQSKPVSPIGATWFWFIPFLPLAILAVIYLSAQHNAAFLLANRMTHYLPDTLWAWLTFFGNGWGAFAMCFPLLLLAPRLLTAGIFAGAAAAIMSPTLKALFDTPRPAAIFSSNDFYQIGEPLLQKAFPSGHTLTAFAITTALFFSCDKNARRPLLLLFLLASLIGVSRIGVGAHWVTDVLGGAAFGFWCGLIGASLTRYLPERTFLPTKLWPRIIACGGVVAIYMHLTRQIDLALNLPLQYASVALVLITLAFFAKAQFAK
jgi:membrane-associated phospholipid phosphatase